MLIPTMSQMGRAERSARLLGSKGAKRFGQGLFVEDDERARLRDPVEVVERVRGLWIVARVADGSLGLPEARALADAAGGDRILSAAERAYLDAPDVAEDLRSRFSWGKESAVALLWALEALERMGWPDRAREDREVAAGVDSLDGRPPALRAKGAILDGFDLFLRILWIVCDASGPGRRPPFPIVPDLVRARVRAFLWLTRARDLDWDAIVPDAFAVPRRA